MQQDWYNDSQSFKVEGDWQADEVIPDRATEQKQTITPLMSTEQQADSLPCSLPSWLTCCCVPYLISKFLASMTSSTPCSACSWTTERQKGCRYESHVKLFNGCSDRGVWSLGSQLILKERGANSHRGYEAPNIPICAREDNNPRSGGCRRLGIGWPRLYLVQTHSG